jgi:hypothetical protein
MYLQTRDRKHPPLALDELSVLASEPEQALLLRHHRANLEDDLKAVRRELWVETQHRRHDVIVATLHVGLWKRGVRYERWA